MYINYDMQADISQQITLKQYKTVHMYNFPFASYCLLVALLQLAETCSTNTLFLSVTTGRFRLTTELSLTSGVWIAIWRRICKQRHWEMTCLRPVTVKRVGWLRTLCSIFLNMFTLHWMVWGALNVSYKVVIKRRRKEMFQHLSVRAASSLPSGNAHLITKQIIWYRHIQRIRRQSVKLGPFAKQVLL